MASTRLSRRAWGTVSLLVLAGTLVSGQSGPTSSPPAVSSSQTPVFRGGANFVSVDAYPRRDGKIVEGLTASDFQIFEDGKPQAVATFEFVTTERNPVDAARRDPESQAEGDRIARDPHNRVFVVYLDLAHTTRVGSLFAERPIVDFLTRTIGATDVFGFMTPELPAGQLAFGRRTEAIEAQLSQFKGWGQAGERPWPRNAIEEQLTQCSFEWERLVLLYREDLLQTSLENLMARLGDLRDERKNILFISEGWVPRRPAVAVGTSPSTLAGPYSGGGGGGGPVGGPRVGPGGGLGREPTGSGGQIPGIGVGRGGRLGIDNGSDAVGRPDPSRWCLDMMQRLGAQDFEQRFRDLLVKARRANVSFYPVDVGGLKTGSQMADEQPGARIPTFGERMTSLNGARNTLLTLADNTDGYAVTNTNDIGGAVRRISDDLSSFYLLGYYSTNTALNGRYREIEVKLGRRGVNVSARRGYVALTPEAMARGVPSGPPTPVDVEQALGRLARIREDADIFLYAVGAPEGIDVVAELSPAVMRGRPAGATGTVAITATAADGSELETEASLPTGASAVRLTIPGATPARGPWQIRARTDGPGGPFEGRADTVTAPMILAGLPVALRGASNARVPFTPTADVRLRRSERLRVEWPVINPSATFQSQLFGRNGQPLKTTLPALTRAAEGRAVVLDLPMMALPEGDFVLELTATSGETIERRLFAFRVIR